MKENFLKRSFDFTLSLVGIVISITIWILIGLLILIEDGWPIFYSHERVGKRGKIFKILKFRSMIKDAELAIGPIQAKKNDPRITKVGKLLRATAMDELPQLLNILKGNMSFVGPRALRPKEIENTNCINIDGNEELEVGNREPGKGDCDEAMSLEKIPGYYKRQNIRPGLTGIAQIYLPSEAPRQQKFRYDLLYIKKLSFWLDLKLIILSFLITFRGKWGFRQRKLWNWKNRYKKLEK